MRSDTTIRRETDIRQKILLHKIKIDPIQEGKMKYYIGVDLGTSAVKLLLMDQEGQVVNIVSREYPLSFPHQKNIHYIFHTRAGQNRIRKTGGNSRKKESVN